MNEFLEKREKRRFWNVAGWLRGIARTVANYNGRANKISLVHYTCICNNKYVTEVYDKRENFNFKIVNYPYMCSNIPAKPT